MSSVQNIKDHGDLVEHYFAENFESTGKINGKVVEATSQYLKIAFDNELSLSNLICLISENFIKEKRGALQV